MQSEFNENLDGTMRAMTSKTAYRKIFIYFEIWSVKPHYIRTMQKRDAKPGLNSENIAAILLLF